jgi:hypothetical protein
MELNEIFWYIISDIKQIGIGDDENCQSKSRSLRQFKASPISAVFRDHTEHVIIRPAPINDAGTEGKGPHLKLE